MNTYRSLRLFKAGLEEKAAYQRGQLKKQRSLSYVFPASSKFFTS